MRDPKNIRESRIKCKNYYVENGSRILEEERNKFQQSLGPVYSSNDNIQNKTIFGKIKSLFGF
jgi:hypothetical protein